VAWKTEAEAPISLVRGSPVGYRWQRDAESGIRYSVLGVRLTAAGRCGDCSGAHSKALARVRPRAAEDRARRSWIAGLACTLSALILAGCASSGSSPLTSTESIPQPPQQQATPPRQSSIKVALLVPLSGQAGASIVGKSLRQAAELALFERDNPAVQLIVKDDKGTPEGARAAADEALKEGAGLILGPLFAKSVTAVAPTARAANVPVVAFSNDRSVAGNGVHLLGFQPGPDVQRIVAYASAQGKKRFVALVPDDPLGRIAGAVFKDAVAKAGGNVIAMETYPMSANAVLEPLRKIATVIEAADAEAPIDALFLPGAQEHLEMVGRLLPQANIDTQKVKILGTGGMDYPNAGRDQRLVGAWFPGPDPSGWNDFSQKFAKSYGAAPPRIAALAYDGVSLAIAASGGAQPFASATLSRPNGYTGVDGTFRLTPEGGTERGLAILEVKKFGSAIVEPASAVGSGPVSGIPKPISLN
jgi:branched-chain amino acid transport system substrate-binding protein